MLEISALCFDGFVGKRACHIKPIVAFFFLANIGARSVNERHKRMKTNRLALQNVTQSKQQNFSRSLARKLSETPIFFPMITSLPDLKGPRGSPAGEILPRHASRRRKKVRTIEQPLLLRSYGIAYSVG